MPNPPQILNDIVDVVLSYRPAKKAKKKSARKSKKAAKKGKG